MAFQRSLTGLANNPFLFGDDLSSLTLVDLIKFLTDKEHPGGSENGAPFIFDDGNEAALEDMFGAYHSTTFEDLIGAHHDHEDHSDHGRQQDVDKYSSLLNDAADGRPAHAGGTKNTDPTGEETTGTKGNGKGKTKEEPPPDDGTGGTTGDGTTSDSSGGDSGTGSSGGTTETNDGSTAPNGYVSGMDTPDGFNVELIFNGSWTDSQKQYAYDAAEKLSNVILGDLPSYNGIDDVRLQLYIQDIDGGGKIWGQGGWIQLRPDGQVAEGGLILDKADIGTAESWGYLDELMMHEMLHGIGFGTSWVYQGLEGSSGGMTRFTGDNAIDVYNTTYSSIAGGDSGSLNGVPLTSDGGHLNEGIFDAEMGTPTLDAGEALSPLTIAILEDMGFDTVYDDPNDPNDAMLLV